VSDETIYSTGFSWCPSASTLLHAIVQRLTQLNANFLSKNMKTSKCWGQGEKNIKQVKMISQSWSWANPAWGRR